MGFSASKIKSVSFKASSSNGTAQPDGNGIYSGSGIVPPKTTSTITDNLFFEVKTPTEYTSFGIVNDYTPFIPIPIFKKNAFVIVDKTTKEIPVALTTRGLVFRERIGKTSLISGQDLLGRSLFSVSVGQGTSWLSLKGFANIGTPLTTTNNGLDIGGSLHVSDGLANGFGKLSVRRFTDIDETVAIEGNQGIWNGSLFFRKQFLTGVKKTFADLYVAEANGIGTGALHIKNEQGHILKLIQGLPVLETLGFVKGRGKKTRVDSTYTGNIGLSAYTIGDIVKHLKNMGVLAF